MPRALKYTRNGSSIITYRAGFCGEILIRVRPLVIVPGILVCLMEATYPLGCALQIPGSGHRDTGLLLIDVQEGFKDPKWGLVRPKGVHLDYD